MGDSLKAASRFVSQSMNSLDDLMTSDPLNNVTAIDQLASLQRRAKTMRARSIYRAAQTAVDMIHKGDAPQRVQSEFVVIRSLVEQYKSGLDEVLAEMPAEDTEAENIEVSALQDANPVHDATFETPVNDMIDSLNMQLQASLSDDIANDVSETARVTDDISTSIDLDADIEVEASKKFSESTQILEPLIQYAPTEAQRDALHNLSNFQTRLIQKDTTKIQQVKPKSRSVEFESFMPELTNFVLTNARHSGKTASISYAANSVRLGQEVADILRDALLTLTSILVRQSLETPEVRRERGESGAGHISITSTLVQGKVHLVIECTGRDINSADLEDANWTRLKTLGANVTLGRDADRFKLILKDLPVYVQSNKRRDDVAVFDIEQAS